MTSTPQRRTRQGATIADALAGLDEFMTAQDIHDLLRARGEKIGLATVYRHLQALTDAGEVDVIRTADGQASYRGCGEATHDHHHHLICRSCGRTVEVELDGVEELIDRLSSAHGYTDVDHSLELRGLCATCSAA
ncbi:transcriptional repressor [Propioniciclava coleopterorum]|uniref:Transcriptional repressor n=1 Tax=Propioniciclava coleopterorum TaxID=2714937 RepID=A0A6G7Y2T9_9ACTN|nr:transcriptional repressor [Propioniciclava coleopterorum]QIK71006.1 transcriptional repressor [Propioniciclava coleopterorum]